jgi:hypothetical protein
MYALLSFQHNTYHLPLPFKLDEIPGQDGSSSLQLLCGHNCAGARSAQTSRFCAKFSCTRNTDVCCTLYRKLTRRENCKTVQCTGYMRSGEEKIVRFSLILQISARKLKFCSYIDHMLILEQTLQSACSDFELVSCKKELYN